jgi:hypothetical protein
MGHKTTQQKRTLPEVYGHEFNVYPASKASGYGCYWGSLLEHPLVSTSKGCKGLYHL